MTWVFFRAENRIGRIFVLAWALNSSWELTLAHISFETAEFQCDGTSGDWTQFLCTQSQNSTMELTRLCPRLMKNLQLIVFKAAFDKKGHEDGRAYPDHGQSSFSKPWDDFSMTFPLSVFSLPRGSNPVLLRQMQGPYHWATDFVEQPA